MFTGGVEVFLVDVLLGADAGGDEGRRRYTDICAKATGRTVAEDVPWR
jgi:hypothetical protein